ncbi:MAG: DUF1640 domain-containing protein [Magnetococcales bacterium]|nr:DUF1640 domain-containing protein [Magnetococcales bacterium]
MTSAVIIFGTLAFVKELETAGVSAPQAESWVRALSHTLQQVEESRSEALATKGDILRLERVIAEIRKDIELLCAVVGRDIAASKHDVITWVAGMFIARPL